MMEREPIRDANKLWEGAALLGGAALLSKLIGTLQKIPLQNFAGDEVFGLYSAVYALAVMWMTLAAAGIPVAVSVLVAERAAHGDNQGVHRLLRWSLALLAVSGLLMFGVLYAGADLLADWMGAQGAAPAIRMSSAALLFAPAAAVLRGYHQGKLRMMRPALSQLTEQMARVAFMLIALAWAINNAWSPSAAAAAVHGGLAAGAAAGLIALLWPRQFRRQPVFILGGHAKKALPAHPARTVLLPQSRLKLLKTILSVAVPVGIASVVAPMLGLIDAFSIPRLLQQEHVEAARSMAEFGIYNRGVALLQLVIMAAAGGSCGFGAGAHRRAGTGR
ncbi:oligosaccharide flippase family protein [Cohnella kolymensis]|uniref:oligosaccharide flippase family protein n=1 Tax=Cohnella kolymensis TaxID=1590652 RepID=UPI000698A1AD|nr:oligosaccharide flippase family protein [Cohnella kolymensis]